MSLAPWGLEWKDDGITSFFGLLVVAAVVVVDADVVSVFGRLVFCSFHFAVSLEGRNRNSFLTWKSS